MLDQALKFTGNPSRPPVCGTSASMSWKSSLALPAPARLRKLHDFFISLPGTIAASRQPRQDTLISTECPPEWAERDGRIDIMSDAAGAQSSWLIAHSGRGHAFTLDLTRAFAADTEVQTAWLDTITGKETYPGVMRVTSSAKFVPAIPNMIDRSAVLVVRTKCVDA